MKRNAHEAVMKRWPPQDLSPEQLNYEKFTPGEVLVRIGNSSENTQLADRASTNCSLVNCEYLRSRKTKLLQKIF